jgi:two-component system response regulator PilR (NtrC family)
MASVLVVDDERSMRDYLEILLRKNGYEVQTAPNLGVAKPLMESGGIDLVITDIKLGSESGLDLVAFVSERKLGLEIMVITAFSTTETAIQAMKLGAYDYLEKPFKNEKLLALCEKAVEKSALLRENARLRARLGSGDLLGESQPIRDIRALVDKVAPSRTTVLIEGESGTGKELVARRLHDRSGRSGSFVAMNCGAIARDLVESELFGHAKGAFTGAVSAGLGLFRAADKGTLFLDEIGELPLAMQVKLLRVLQERTVRPVGDTESYPVDVRIVAATNRSLQEEVTAGRFREDLYYRLNVVQILVPPLRDRSGDVLLLARHFVAHFGDEMGRPQVHIAPEVEAALMQYRWAGNVRELENVCERAVALTDGLEINVDALPPMLRGTSVVAPDPAVLNALPAEGLDLEAYLEATERRLLLEALKQAGGVRTEAARILRLSFRSLRYRLAKLGVRSAEDEPPKA